MWNGFGTGNLQPFSCDPWGPEKPWAWSSADFAPERENLGVRTVLRQFLHCSRTSGLDIPVLCGSLGWVQPWCVVKFGMISIGWTALLELKACGGVSTESAFCAGQTMSDQDLWEKCAKKNKNNPLGKVSLFLGVEKASKRAFTMHKSSTLRSIISCWFKGRDEHWLAWEGGNAAFLCSKSCWCLYLSSTGVA